MNRNQVATDEDTCQAEQALGALTAAFERAHELTDATRWAVAHALTYLDDEVAYEVLLRDFLDRALGRKGRPPKAERERYQCAAYLIGRLRLQEPEAWRVLGRCLPEAQQRSGPVADRHRGAGLVGRSRTERRIQNVA